MHGLMYHGPLDIRYGTLDDARLGDEHSALVQVTAAGICGSDLHIYEGHGFSPTTGYCVGHEAVGVVVEVGAQVRRHRVGDRVMVSASAGCGVCDPCHRGEVARCERPGIGGCYGLGHALGGCQAELLAVPAADMNMVGIGDEISDDAAIVLTDNAPTAWFGARQARIRPGDSVAVVGLGPVGLMAVCAAQLMGAGRVFGIDLVDERRAKAEELGAEPIAGDAKAAVREATGGKGVDVVIEAVGADATIALSLAIAGRAARVSVIGVAQSRAFPFDMTMAQVKCLEFTAGLCSVQRELPTLLALTAAGRLKPESVVSHHMPLADGADAYARFHARENGVLKVVLDV